jgi:AAA+ superfamily predicted ATPase
VSRKLAEMYPESVVLECEPWSFDLCEFAEAGQCSILSLEQLHCQQQASWCKTHDRMEYTVENGWFSVWWEHEGQERVLDVLALTWSESGCHTTRHWVIADTRELAEQFVQAVCEYCGDVHGEILVFQGDGWAKDDKLFASIKSASFDNLIKPHEFKQELRGDLQRFFASRELYERYNLPWKRGVLFVGPPGNGKTHAIKALVNELALPCLYVKSFRSSHNSEQSGMRVVFGRARKLAPCIVVLEDIDALVEDENRSFLLNELDGFAENHGIVVLATTNHPERLDPALLDRPSRFDRKYNFGLPALAERLAYFKQWNETLQPDMRLSPPTISDCGKRTQGFSFAYLKELFLSAMMQWVTDPQPGRMDEVMRLRVEALHEQKFAEDLLELVKQTAESKRQVEAQKRAVTATVNVR